MNVTIEQLLQKIGSLAIENDMLMAGTNKFEQEKVQTSQQMTALENENKQMKEQLEKKKTK